MTEQHSFQEVMQQCSRICKHYWTDPNEDDFCSARCPLFNLWCPLLDDAFKNIGEVDFEKVERVVMEWAAEHPEPVFPTWFDYIYEMCKDTCLNDREFVQWMNTTHIPVEIADKLGIKPKVIDADIGG